MGNVMRLFQESCIQQLGHHGRAGGYIQFGKYSPEIGTHRPDADIQYPGDHFIGEPLGDHAGDSPLARAERRRRGILSPGKRPHQTLAPAVDLHIEQYIFDRCRVG